MLISLHSNANPLTLKVKTRKSKKEENATQL